MHNVVMVMFATNCFALLLLTQKIDFIEFVSSKSIGNDHVKTNFVQKLHRIQHFDVFHAGDFNLMIPPNE